MTSTQSQTSVVFTNLANVSVPDFKTETQEVDGFQLARRVMQRFRVPIEFKKYGHMDRFFPIGHLFVHKRFKLAYIRMPKAGSTTIEDVLVHKGFEFVDPELTRCINPPHPLSCCYDTTFKHYYLCCPNCFHFTFVRDPITRFFSAFRTVAGNYHKPMPTSESACKNAISEFVYPVLDWILPPKGQRDRPLHHALPFVYQISPQGVVLNISFIGRIETLETDWGDLSHSLFPDLFVNSWKQENKQNYADLSMTCTRMLVKGFKSGVYNKTKLCEYYKNDYELLEYPSHSLCKS